MKSFKETQLFLIISKKERIGITLYKIIKKNMINRTSLMKLKKIN